VGRAIAGDDRGVRIRVHPTALTNRLGAMLGRFCSGDVSVALPYRPAADARMHIGSLAQPREHKCRDVAERADHTRRTLPVDQERVDPMQGTIGQEGRDTVSTRESGRNERPPRGPLTRATPRVITSRSTRCIPAASGSVRRRRVLRR
jgi:hypothetical protein